jgi:hypothetical protein
MFPKKGTDVPRRPVVWVQSAADGQLGFPRRTPSITSNDAKALPLQIIRVAEIASQQNAFRYTMQYHLRG